MLEIDCDGAAGTRAEHIPTWVRAHGDVLSVARERAGLERREGACMLRAFREDVHRHLGYGAFAEYSDRHLGFGHRATRDKLRTAEALERLPELAHALADGRLHASAIRELARVATPETEVAWIEAAAGRRETADVQAGERGLRIRPALGGPGDRRAYPRPRRAPRDAQAGRLSE